LLAWHSDWNQSHIAGLSLYVPLFGACAWTPAAYEVRSASTAGLICQFAFLDEGFSFENARVALAEAKVNQKFWYGDFYLLTSQALGTSALVAYQLHRSDLDAGSFSPSAGANALTRLSRQGCTR